MYVINVTGQLFDARSESARIEDDAGRALPGVTSFWFAWYTFHPDTEVFSAPRRP